MNLTSDGTRTHRTDITSPAMNHCSFFVKLDFLKSTTWYSQFWKVWDSVRRRILGIHHQRCYLPFYRRFLLLRHLHLLWTTAASGTLHEEYVPNRGRTGKTDQWRRIRRESSTGMSRYEIILKFFTNSPSPVKSVLTIPGWSEKSCQLSLDSPTNPSGSCYYNSYVNPLPTRSVVTE